MPEKAVPHNDIVYKLRESMLNTTEGENSPALERMLEEEIKARPGDVGLRIRLVTLLQDQRGLQPVLRAGAEAPVVHIQGVVLLSRGALRELQGESRLSLY